MDWIPSQVVLNCILLCLRIIADCWGYISLVKLFTGRPRPCFFDMCGYPKNGDIYGVFGRAGDISKCTARVVTFPASHE